MAFDTPRVDFAVPPAAALGVSMEGPDWTVVALHGGGFRPDDDVQAWDAVDYNTRGTPGPPRPGNGVDGYWPVGNVSATEFQILAPTCEDPCVVDIRIRRRANAAPPDAGTWTEWIPAVVVIGDPPLPAPTVMAPTAGAPGTRVLINGTGLLHAKAVNVGGTLVPLPALGRTDISVAFEIPVLPGIVEPADLEVFVTYGASLSHPAGEVVAGTFRYLPPGVAVPTDYDPKEGVVDGGTLVRIEGSALDLVLAVRVGANSAQLLYSDFDSILCATPPAAEPGIADIYLQVPDPVEPDRRSVLPPASYAEVPVGPFTYTARPPAPPPVITGFVPASGPTSGGTVLTISGVNLDQITEVRVGGAAATDLDVAFGRIVCRTPPRGAAGAVLVEAYYPGEPGRVVAPGLFDYTVLAPPSEEVCRREAWLTLPGRELPLEDLDAGYVCVELDIGWPTVREVVTNAPDQDGLDDRTSLLGGRVVTAHVIAGGLGGHRTPDDIARAFGPFLSPRVRPVLHWRVDSPETEQAERTLVLRSSEFTAPIGGAFRDIHIAWVAPDPVVRAAVFRETQARPAYSGASGRRYDLTFDRSYPSGAGGAVSGQIISPGDVDVFPTVRIFGPVTGPSFTITAYPPDVAPLSSAFVFRSAFRIDAGRAVDVDCRAHTAIADDGTRVEAQIDWARTTWPVALGGGILNVLAVAGASTDHITQALAVWRDGFLAI